jgi:hypothetical protein
MMSNTNCLGRHLAQEIKDRISASHPPGRSGHKGVVWSRQKGKWQVRVRGEHFGFYGVLADAVQTKLRISEY